MRSGVRIATVTFIATSMVVSAPTIARAGCALGTGSDDKLNTCVGNGALERNTTGIDNTATGAAALTFNTSGNANTAVGSLSLRYNTSGINNTAVGSSALSYNTVGQANTAVGVLTLASNTSGGGNSACGYGSLNYNTTGASNTAAGIMALTSNTVGNENVAVGSVALGANGTGSNNVAVGSEAGRNQSSGDNNVYVGHHAGYNVTTGSNNIAIGNTGSHGDMNTIRVGVQGTQTRTFIAGVRGTIIPRGLAVRVSTTGQLGISSSSRRYKEGIMPMGDASSALMMLRPVTFRYKQAEPDGSKPVQYGLIAEEVETAMPDIVLYNADGTPESVAYDALPPLLLNEYQKQGRELVAMKARVDAMDAELASLRQMMARLAPISQAEHSLNVAQGEK